MVHHSDEHHLEEPEQTEDQNVTATVEPDVSKIWHRFGHSDSDKP